MVLAFLMALSDNCPSATERCILGRLRKEPALSEVAGVGSKPSLLTIGIFQHLIIIRLLCEPLQHLGDGQLSQPGVPAGTQPWGGI